ncbi:nucleoprotein TPR-like isoform X3 [Apostichopus japonicus]|uniref:nucleoprotein TPR-like isoform X3 n=1 Tax=Stichopus japonicus TaxID=307972 RepID=UPI003AB8C9AA
MPTCFKAVTWRYSSPSSPVTMATSNVLAVALSEDAIAALSPETLQKLEGLFNSKEDVLTSLKTQLEKLKVNSEQRFQQLETEWVKTNTQLEKESSEAAELRTSKTKLEEQLKKSEDELTNLKERTEGSFGTHQELTRANEQLTAEKQEMVTIIDRKTKQIQRLNDEWKSMSEKLAAADMAKSEIQMKLDEVQHEDFSGKFREKRFEQEKEMLSSQIDWLEKSLKEKIEEVLSLRKEKSNQIVELQSDLSSREDDIKQLQDQVKRMEKTLEEQTKKMEETRDKLQENLDVISRNEEQFNGELQAQKKLTDIYKQTSDEHEGRVRELISAVEELQKLLKLATDAQEELEVNNKKMEATYTTEKEELVKKIDKMEQELDNANDLLAAARKKGLTPLSEEELTSLSPTAAAASSFIKSGMTLTQMYSEYIKASEALQSEKLENQRLNEYMDQILQEIEEKAPILQQQREDYEKSLETTNQLSIRLDAALLECEQQRVTADEAERRRSHVMREKERLKQQTVDLGQQVRVLLREVHEVRGGPITSEEFEPGVSSSDVTSSSQVIDRHLVTFKNIEEIQKQNADLLNLVRVLSEKREAEENENLESKTLELKTKLESALEEVAEMRDGRRRQMEMVESVVRQRDMYRVLLAQNGGSPPPLSVSLLQRSPGPVSQSPGAPSPVKGANSNGELEKTPQKSPVKSTVNQEDKDRALEALQGEFETYRKEKAVNESMLSDQLDTMRKDLSDFRVQNAKLSSQLEFASERFKILQATADSYKSEITATREKNQRLSSEMVKLQQSLTSLSEDLLASQERANKFEIECHNAKSEKELLKQVELRLDNENESLRNEQRNQNLLLTNLQQIQTNLERSDFETKSRLTNQMSSMERELNMVRRKLDGEGEQHRTVLKTWESKVRELDRQLANEMESHQKTKDDLTKSKVDLQAMKQQCSSVEAQLVAAQIKLESAHKELKDLESAKDSTDGGRSELELRALKQQLSQKEKEIQELNDKVGKAEQHVEQYKTISEAVEQSLKEQNEASQTFKDTMEKRLQEANAALQATESKLSESEAERDQLRSENQGLGDAANAQTAELRKNISKLQEEIKETTSRCTEAESKEAAARHDCQEQSKVAQEACDKYEREVVLHAADIQQLVTVKEQLTNHNKKLSEAEETAKKALDELAASKASWEEQLRVQKEQVKSIQNRCDELEGQNGMLHQQLETLSTQIIDFQTEASGSTSGMNLSFSEENKSSEQLLEVIKFLRREKEIAETRLEVTQGESLRIKQKCDSMKRQVSELQEALQEERGRAEAMAKTRAQHENLRKKVETLNAVTDSNRLLREEKDKLELDFQQAEAKVQQLEKVIIPIQEQVREQVAKLESLTTEKTALAAEASKWRLRANHLIEQYNKVDPDEQKKLLQEKESNKKTIADQREEALRYKAELSKLNQLLSNARTEISKLDMAQTSTQSKHNLEVQKLKEELNIAKADLKSKTDEVKAKTADIEEKNKISNQVKRLGRKYKSQFEEAKAEVDRLQARLTSQEAEAAKPNPESEAKIRQLEEKVQHVNQENSSLKQTEENLKTQVAEKEERHEKQRRVLQSAKQKITQLTSDKEKHLMEQEKLQKELSELQALKMQMERKMDGQKQEHLARISALEREVKDIKADRDKIRAERVQEQLARDSQLDQMEGHPSSLLTTPDRASSSREEPPPTANIKPLSSPASAVGTAKGIQVSSGQKATASIRPIAVTPSTSSGVSSSTSTRMATVMPHTIEQPTQVNVPDDHEVQTSDPPTMPIVSATPIQAVTPTQQTPLIARTEPISQQEPEPYIDDTPLSGPSTSSEPPSSSSAGPPPNIPTSGKRQRDEPTESDQSSSIERDILPPTEKRQRVTPQPQIARVQAQEEPHIPHVMREAERASVAEVLPERSDRDHATPSIQPEQVEVVMGSVAPEQVERVIGTVQGEQVEPVAPSNQADTPQASQSSSDDHHKQGDRSTEPQSTGPPEHLDERMEDEEPTPSSQDGNDEDVILVEDSDGEGVGQKMPGEVESDVDKEVSDYDDEDDEGELVGQFDDGNYVGEEGTDYSDDEETGTGADLAEDMIEEDSVTSADEMEGTGREVVEIIDEDEEEHGEASQTGSDSPRLLDRQDQEGVPQSSSRGQGPPPQLVVEPPEHSGSQVEVVAHSAPQPVVISGVPRPRERLPSTGRQLPAFSFAAFEDTGDDCQVPSTPTLFVPHRNDGFAEAINSPLVQPGHQRFQFSTHEGTDTHRAPGLAQLASQGDLGVDDTLIYLPGGDDEAGSSRSVPTTPIQTLAPVSVAEASPSLAEAIPRPESTVTPSGADGVQTSSAVRPSSRGTDEAGISQQRSSASPSPPTSSEQVSQAQLSALTSSGRSKEDEDRSTVSGSEDISMETATNAAGNRPETSGTQPTSGNAQPSSSGDGETKKSIKRIIWSDGPSTTQQVVQPQSSSQETVRPTPRPQTAIRGGRGRFIQRTFPGRSRGKGPRFSRGGRGGTS